MSACRSYRHPSCRRRGEKHVRLYSIVCRVQCTGVSLREASMSDAVTPDSPRVPAPARRSRRWLRILIAIVILAVIVLMVLRLVHRKPAARGTPPQVVSVANATNGDMPETLNALGTVTPISTVTVLPQLSGYLTAVGYREGQDVQKGQFLAQIDPRQFEIDKQQ